MPGKYGKTSGVVLEWLQNLSAVADIDEGFQRLAEQCATRLTGYSSGTHAARPAAGGANRTYRETDTGGLFRDNGSAWCPLLLGTAGAKRTLISWGAVAANGVALAGSGDWTAAFQGSNF